MAAHGARQCLGDGLRAVSGHKGNEIGDTEFGAYCNRELDYQVVIAHIVPEYWPRLQALEIAKPMIGYTAWETDQLPQHWLALLDAVTQVMVPCQWNQSVFKKAGVRVPINVIPHLLELPYSENHGENPQVGIRNRGRSDNLQADGSLSGINDGDFVFYSISACTVRKDIWASVSAYLDVFSADDPVVLVIKTTKHDYTYTRRRWLRMGYARTRDTLRKILAKYSRPARVLLIDHECDSATMAALQQRGDCYVSLCHSESWGLEAFEAAGRGKPIVITGYGGQLDYLPQHLCYLVRYTLSAVHIEGHPPQTRDQHWALPDRKHAGELLREVFVAPDIAKSRGQQLQHYVQEHFSKNKIITSMLECINTARSVDQAAELPTLVSAYYDIGDFIKGRRELRTRHTYESWLQNFALIDNPLIFFVDNEDDRRMIEQMRHGQRKQTKVLVVPEEDLLTFKNINKVKSSIANADFRLGSPNTVCAEYSLLMHSKFEFIERAIAQGLVTTQALAWMDCGKIFDVLALKPQKRYVVRQAEIDLNKIHYSEITAFDPSRSLRKIQISNGGHGINWLAGAFFIGGVGAMEQFAKKYLQWANRYQEEGYIFTDQVQLTAMKLEKTA